MRDALRLTVSTFGALAALAGLEHGIGEVVQGNIAPSGIVFESWPGSAFFRIVAGEPAMTILPNLLITGILTIVVSLFFLVWAILFVQRNKGSLVMILLSIVMLLVGGGFGPPLLGIILGLAATRLNAPMTGWEAHLSAGLRHFPKWSWLGSFVVCLIAWLFLCPGLNILGYFFGLDDPNIVVITIFVAFGTLLMTIVMGLARDIDWQTDSHQAPLVSG